MAVTFDGSSGLIHEGSMRGVDSKKGTVLLWGKMDSSAAGVDSFAIFKDSSGNSIASLFWSATASNILTLRTYKTAGGGTIATQTSSAWTSDDGWTCFTFSYDTENGLYHLYRGNTDDGTTVITQADTTVPWSNAVKAEVGGFDMASSPTNPLEGSIAQIAFWPGVYIDLSDEDERRNLVSNDGKPVGFGPDGTGRGGRDGIDKEPIFLFSGAFVKNIGTGGAFKTLGSLSSTRDPDTYRPSADRLTYGIRWYDSDRSGWSYPRNAMLRERFGRKGQRVGIDESDEADRDDFREIDFNDLVDGEEDHEDVL